MGNLENKKKIHRLSVALYVNTEIVYNEKDGDRQVNTLMAVVKQNNEIIFSKPYIGYEMNGAITTETFIMNHPSLENFNLNIVKPDINKMLWRYRTEKTIFG